MKKLFLIPLILFSLISLPSLSDNKNKRPVCKEGLVLSGNKCIKLPKVIKQFDRRVCKKFLDFSVNKCIQLPEGIARFERRIIYNCAPDLELRNEI